MLTGLTAPSGYLPPPPAKLGGEEETLRAPRMSFASGGQKRAILTYVACPWHDTRMRTLHSIKPEGLLLEGWTLDFLQQATTGRNNFFPDFGAVPPMNMVEREMRDRQIREWDQWFAGGGGGQARIERDLEQERREFHERERLNLRREIALLHRQIDDMQRLGWRGPDRE